jgi:hypothetical protein
LRDRWGLILWRRRTKVGRGWSADLDVSVKVLEGMAVSLRLKADRVL